MHPKPIKFGDGFVWLEFCCILSPLLWEKGTWVYKFYLQEILFIHPKEL
jgi:hypothetical protein